MAIAEMVTSSAGSNGRAKLWYEHPDDPAAEPFLVIDSTDGLNALIDRVRHETRDHRCPAAIQVNINGRSGLPVLEVGLGQEKGFIRYYAKDAGSTKGDGDPNDRAEYIYMSHLSVVPADVEVDIHTVRRGLVEFLETGERPSVIVG